MNPGPSECVVADQRVRVAAIRSCDCGLQGPENLILMLAERLRASRFDHVIVNLWDGQPPQVALHDEAVRRGLESEVAATRWSYDPSLVVKLRRLLRRRGVHLVHTYNAKAEVVTLAATIGLGIPRVGSYFGCFPVWPLREQIHEATSLITLRLFQRVLANSGMLKDELRKFGFPARRILVVPSYVDTDEIRPTTAEQRRGARRAFGIAANASVVLQLARLHPEKGHAYVLQALPRIARTHPEVVYLVVGGGWQLDELQRMAGELGVASRVTFTGYHPDRIEALNAADVLITPSLREGLSVSLLEAMATGLPIVATRIYGSAEAVVDGETGRLVEPRNPAALADAVVQLLDDLPSARAMGMAGRRLVEERYSADRVTADIMRCYEDLVRRGVSGNAESPAAARAGSRPGVGPRGR